MQFHVKKNERQEILLGKFNIADQIEWIKNNPNKTPEYKKNKIIKANYIFNGGDVCEETGKLRYKYKKIKLQIILRQTELQLNCPTKIMEINKNAVITLIEPKICSYIIKIESALLCEGLQDVDINGLLHQMPKEKTNLRESIKLTPQFYVSFLNMF